MAKEQIAKGGRAARPTLDARDDIEPELRHLHGLRATFRILGEAGDAIEPVSSLVRNARREVKGYRAQTADRHRHLA
jgi:hypothetical protein